MEWEDLLELYIMMLTSALWLYVHQVPTQQIGQICPEFLYLAYHIKI